MITKDQQEKAVKDIQTFFKTRKVAVRKVYAAKTTNLICVNLQDKANSDDLFLLSDKGYSIAAHVNNSMFTLRIC